MNVNNSLVIVFKLVEKKSVIMSYLMNRSLILYKISCCDIYFVFINKLKYGKCDTQKPFYKDAQQIKQLTTHNHKQKSQNK